MSGIRKLNIFKIKAGMDFGDFLKGDINSYHKYQISEGEYEVFINYADSECAAKTEDQIPWIMFLNSGPAGKKYQFKSQNRYPRAVMAIRIKATDGNNSYFAITFGSHGDNFVDKSTIVYDFGIRVGMNICDTDKLRRIQTSVHEAISRQTERQASTGSSLNNFGIDIEAEFLRTISGNVADKYIDFIDSFRGKESISLNLPKEKELSWDDMADICRKLDDRYSSDDYRNTEFKAYDLLRHENDPLTIEMLDQLLSTNIEERNFSKIHLSTPEFMEGDEISFAYTPKTEDSEPKLYDDLRIEDLVSIPNRRQKDLNSTRMKNWKIYVYDMEDERTYFKWNAYQCIIAEVELDNKTFVLANGQWREISEELRKKVYDHFAQNNIVADIACLPSNVGIFDVEKRQDREDIYNITATKSNKSVFLFDKAKIEIADKKQYEVCDLLTSDKQFVHVKRYSSGSASISHIFTQAKFYSHAFAAEEKTRLSIRKWIVENDIEHNAGKNKDDFLKIIPEKKADFKEGDYTVVFCILHSDDKFDLASLPFMALYELMIAHRFLTEDRSFNVAIAFKRVLHGKAPQ